jgi:hypothetical protein
MPRVREMFKPSGSGLIAAMAALCLMGLPPVGAEALEDDVTVIDMMILYTPEVRAKEGQAGVEGGIRLCVAYLNEAFRQSLIPARVRLVHLGEAAWHHDSRSVGSELGWLIDDPVVKELRDRYGADLVALRISPAVGLKGMATFGPPFSVWTGDPRVFAHEVGHNLYLGHARLEAGSCPPKHPFGYGYVTVPPRGNEQACSDIMGAAGGPPLFSNPAVSYHGAAMGVPVGHLNTWGLDDSADAARAITLELPGVANLKPSRVERLARPRLNHDGTLFSFEIRWAPNEPCGIEWTDNFRDWHLLSSDPTGGKDGCVEDTVGSVETRCYRAWAGGRLVDTQVGFLKRSIPAGISLISNPFDRGDNTLANLFPAVPEGTAIYKWDESALTFTTCIFHDGSWSAPTMTLHPGEGAVIWVPNPQTLRFTGLIQDAFYRPVPCGWSLRGAPMPWAGGLASRQCYPCADGSGGQTDEVLILCGDGMGYQKWSSTNLGWIPAPGPEPRPGEGFWCYKCPNDHLWTGVYWPGTGQLR